MTQHYITVGEFSLKEVFDFVPDNKKRKVKAKFNEHNVKMSSDRLITFKRNHVCVCCSLEGTKFRLQLTQKDAVEGNAPHFNLFAQTNDGEYIMLTKDHIIPIADGGKDVLDNYQTMCEICNSLKAHSKVSLERLRIARSMYNNGAERIDINKFVFNQ